MRADKGTSPVSRGRRRRIIGTPVERYLVCQARGEGPARSVVPPGGVAGGAGTAVAGRAESLSHAPQSWSDELPAVDHDGLGRDPARLVGRREKHDLGDLLGLAHPAKRDGVERCLVELRTSCWNFQRIFLPSRTRNDTRPTGTLSGQAGIRLRPSGNRRGSIDDGAPRRLMTDHGAAPPWPPRERVERRLGPQARLPRDP